MRRSILTLIIVLVVMAICVDSANAVDTKIYFIYEGGGESYIGWCNLDGSSRYMWGALHEQGRGYGLALNIPANKIYCTEWETGYIWRTNMTLPAGSEHTWIPGRDYPIAIEVDACGGKMYWFENTDHIMRANFDGSNIETLLTHAPIDLIFDIALDPPAGKVYWTNNLGGIYRANLDDGTSIELVTSTTPGHSPLGIDLDLVSGKMYWVDGSGSIRRANKDGSGEELLINTSAWGIALDVVSGKVYWTSGRSIMRANLDGSSVETVASWSWGYPYDLELVATPALLTMDIDSPPNGTTMPVAGSTTILAGGGPSTIEALPSTGYYFSGWTACPSSFVTFGDSGAASTTVTLEHNATVTANFALLVDLTMEVSPSETGTTIPVGTSGVIPGVAIPIEAQANSGYGFVSWTAVPSENVVFGNANASSTTATLSGNAIVTANFVPVADLTMAVSPPKGGTTTPTVGTSSVELGAAISIDAQSNAGYAFMLWTAAPPENVVFGNASSQSTTATLSDDATVTANFNANPVADINATANVVVITDANSVTLDATGSTDDGLPDPPGTMTYHWEKVSGPNTCTISDPNEAVTEVSFWGLDSYEFSVTVSDGQLQDVESATVDVVVDVAYVSTDGNDNTGLGTIDNPFETVQKGIDMVQDNGAVIVMPGTYYETIDFAGKKACVRSSNPGDPNIVANTVIDANSSGTVVTFSSAEDTNSILSGFTITGGDTTLGGGIYINGASPIIEKNVITNNSASSKGGGVYCQESSATIRYNKISNNHSFSVGGICFNSSFAVLYNNLIVNNSAEYSSGVACIEGQPRIVNNTIVGNVAVNTFLSASGLYIGSSSLSPIINNNIIGFNDGAPGLVDIFGFDPNYFSYNNVYGHPDGDYLSWSLPTPDQTGVNGNISVDPLFTNIDANDYHLLPGSLLIDAGDPNSGWRSEPRPNGGRINLGVYGNTSEATCSLVGDITWDKKVDFKDFSKLAFYWLQNEPSVDIAPLISGDNIVDEGDLAVLAQNWLAGVTP